jgi:DNA-binding transcriptional LysR family regulator
VSDLVLQTLANQPASLHASHPAVQISMEEGLSRALANRVRRCELDAAIITELSQPDPE